jgi:hypothetical protein
MAGAMFSSKKLAFHASSLVARLSPNSTANEQLSAFEVKETLIPARNFLQEARNIFYHLFE